MNSKHLSLFILVVELGSVTEVAKHTMISQPAVSMQLKRLEEDIGVPLFTPQGRGIILTDAGKTLFEYSKKILMLEEQLLRAMEAYKNGQKGHIIIGATPVIGTYMLPPFLTSFFEAYKDIQLEVCFYNEDLIEKMVKDGRVDLGFMLSSSIKDHLGYRVTPFSRDSWAVIESNKATYSDRYFIDKNASVTFDSSSEFRNLTQVESTEMVKQLVLSGLGRGIVLQSSIQHEISSSLLKSDPINDPANHEVLISIITRPAERLAKSVWFLIDHFCSK